MNDVFRALARSFRELADPKVAFISMIPMFISAFLWVTLVYLFWDNLFELSIDFINEYTGHFVEDDQFFKKLGGVAFIIMLLATIIPLLLFSASIANSLFIMPIILVYLEGRSYSSLKKLGHSTFLKSLGNVMAGSLLYLSLWLFLLPLSISASFLVPIYLWFITGWLSQKLNFYDALSGHANAIEFEKIKKSKRYSIAFLGGLTAVIHMIPIVNIIAPTITSFSFAHFCLNELKVSRSLSSGLSEKCSY